jgi:cellulose synthase (UDP-forming)
MTQSVHSAQALDGVELSPGGDLPEKQPYLVPLLSARQRAAFAACAVCWALSLGAFWWWWLRPEHNVEAFRFAANCVILFWMTVIPGYFVFVFSRARVTNRALAIPAGLRVAMVVTKAPSEPFEVVRTTLLAMLAQSYLHDTWLADEDPSDETRAWCAQHGVQLSTRKGVSAYHNPSWPRRTRCKEGNLAYFYDHYGYERYDFVAQLDADHVPESGYLEAMLRPFADPRVGYVSAPSICDSNAASSWAARGRLHVEGALHGALQAGHNGGLAPLCIGSHYAVRTAALRQIGGLGPELAEDHSTTLLMNAKGWRGVHALDAIAHGEGPRTFADMVTQEYQWSKSLAVILLRYTRHYFAPLPLRLKCQFLFAQLWYPLFSLTMAATVVMPVLALATRRVWANVAYTSYLAYASTVTVSILLLMGIVKRTGCFRPCNAKVLSWEGTVFVFARWPWSLLGTCSAVVDCLRQREFAFRVTPKGTSIDSRPPPRVVLPYLLISLFCGVPLLLIGDAGSARGFYVISILNALMYLGVALLVLTAHAREQGQRDAVLRLAAAQGPLLQRACFAVAALTVATGLSMRMSDGVDGLLWRGGMEVAAAEPREPLLVGLYDPSHVFAADNAPIDIEHVFVYWNDPQIASQIQDAYAYASARRRQLMLTVEPWPSAPLDGAMLLSDTRRGAYDADIATLCTSLRALNAPVMVRWAQEMESPTGRYPWATHDPWAFVHAYRHFVDRCRGGEASALRFVWSPRGDAGLEAYFPGRDYADFVGLSVFDCPSCGIQPAGDLHSASSILNEKYRRVVGFKLPVIVAELGIEGTPERQRTELAQLTETVRQLPKLKAVAYFNAPDMPGAWPWPHQPDWRISRPLLDLFAADQAEESR